MYMYRILLSCARARVCVRVRVYVLKRVNGFRRLEANAPARNVHCARGRPEHYQWTSPPRSGADQPNAAYRSAGGHLLPRRATFSVASDEVHGGGKGPNLNNDWNGKKTHALYHDMHIIVVIIITINIIAIMVSDGINHKVIVYPTYVSYTRTAIPAIRVLQPNYGFCVSGRNSVNMF